MLKRLVIELSEREHRKIKEICAGRGTAIRKFILDLIDKELRDKPTTERATDVSK